MVVVVVVPALGQRRGGGAARGQHAAQGRLPALAVLGVVRLGGQGPRLLLGRQGEPFPGPRRGQLLHPAVTVPQDQLATGRGVGRHFLLAAPVREGGLWSTGVVLGQEEGKVAALGGHGAPLEQVPLVLHGKGHLLVCLVCVCVCGAPPPRPSFVFFVRGLGVGVWGCVFGRAGMWGGWRELRMGQCRTPLVRPLWAWTRAMRRARVLCAPGHKPKGAPRKRRKKESKCVQVHPRVEGSGPSHPRSHHTVTTGKLRAMGA